MNIRELEQTFMVEGKMLLHSGSIFFLSSERGLPTHVFSKGTFALVDTGMKKLLVTCEHIWAAFLQEVKKNVRTRLAILLGTNRPVLLPESTYVSSCRSLDLATFDMAPLLPEFTSRQFFRFDKNWLPRMQRKDALAVLGYLGKARHISSGGVIFGYHFLGISVADISGFHICADLTTTKTYRDPDGAEIPRVSSLGGMSGSPCFRLEKDTRLSLVGFVTSEALGIVRFTHAACLNPDGTISSSTKF